MGHYWATSKLSQVSHKPPPLQRTLPYVQCRRYMSCRLSYLDTHAPYAICPHTEPYTRTSPLSARSHAQCWRHMPCCVSQQGPHGPCAICPHTDPYVQPRGSALIPFVTSRPPTPHSPAFRGAGPHTRSTLFTLSFSLRVKGSTRRCYGCRIKTYKLAPSLLN
jgi:hypothetical protein